MFIRPIVFGFLVTVLAGCSILPKDQRSIRGIEQAGPDGPSVTYSIYENGVVTEKTYATLYSEFILAKAAAGGDRKDKEKITEYLDAGIAFSNKACSEWFAINNGAMEQVNKRQGFTNLIGDTAIAALSLTKAGVDPMGYAALALGGINSGFEVMKKNDFLTGTLWKLEKGVREGRVTAAQNLKSNMAGAKPYTYYEAQDALLEYHNTCSRIRLIAYIEASVELARYTPDASMDKSIATSSDVFMLSKEIYKAVYQEDGVFTEKWLKDLYVIFSAPKSESAATLVANNSEYKAIQGTISKLGTQGADEQKAKEKTRASTFMKKLAEVGSLLGLEKALEEKAKKVAEAEKEVEDKKQENADAEKAAKDAANQPKPDPLNESLVISVPQVDAAGLKTLMDKLNVLKNAPVVTTESADRKSITLQTVPKN